LHCASLKPGASKTSVGGFLEMQAVAKALAKTTHHNLEKDFVPMADRKSGDINPNDVVAEDRTRQLNTLIGLSD
jgi:hypothetical protein